MGHFQKSPDPFAWLDPEEDCDLGPFPTDDFWISDVATTDNLTILRGPPLGASLTESISTPSTVDSIVPHNLFNLHGPELYWSPDDVVNTLPELSQAQLESVTPSTSTDTDWTVSPGSYAFSTAKAKVQKAARQEFQRQRERRKRERPSKCPLCDLGHAYDADMRRHIRAKHPDQAWRFNVSTKKLRCKWCVKSFSRSDHLTRHLKRKHSGP
ncbi:hypothetical protein B0T22DRAFT_439787 [Podospora appendiculata]|uniref:C2H2-type domain-containing protein n=1 Tax=Podospora appendiculata TaxID=314037 RepID=A0AAE1CC71_9PEZI|nr:hypothetical protein B0T22DRAFT_439787 [Podospora appendiculata]